MDVYALHRCRRFTRAGAWRRCDLKLSRQGSINGAMLRDAALDA